VRTSNPALREYIDAMRVVNALRQFKKEQKLSRRLWDTMISVPTQILLCAQHYVKIGKDEVHLTHEGLMMLGSTLAGD
jgi:hypothetical protein